MYPSDRSARSLVEQAIPQCPRIQDDIARSPSAQSMNQSACTSTEPREVIRPSVSAMSTCERFSRSPASPDVTPFAIRPLLARTTASYSQCVTSPPFLPRSCTLQESSGVGSTSPSFRLPWLSPLKLAIAVCEEGELADPDSTTEQATTISEFSGIRSSNPAFPPPPPSLPDANEDLPSGSLKLPTPEEMMAQDMFNNCAVRFVVSGVMGGGMGIMMGLLFGALDQPLNIEEMTLRQQLTHGARQMVSRSWHMAKAFAVMGAIFSAAECTVEKARAKHDAINTVVAGCITGGAISYQAGPQAACVGCVGFAAFSLLIEKVMERWH